MTVPVPPPHLLKKFNQQAYENSRRRGQPNSLKAFAVLCIEWAMNSQSTPNDRQIRSSIPEEVVTEWGHSAPVSYDPDHWGYEQYIAQMAADWELEACCEFLRKDLLGDGTIERLQAARRPKPISRAEALRIIDENIADSPGRIQFALEEIKTIRRALEALDD